MAAMTPGISSLPAKTSKYQINELEAALILGQETIKVRRSGWSTKPLEGWYLGERPLNRWS